ncbi:hypothetical protein LC55x_1635 [Lysobacter capsici]|nr:hypothetical protein LC55x_1635 [Lysobacter capsici]
MNGHPIFDRLLADLAAAGLLRDGEQRAGETLAPSHDDTDMHARARVATPVRPYPPIGDAEL